MTIMWTIMDAPESSCENFLNHIYHKDSRNQVQVVLVTWGWPLAPYQLQRCNSLHIQVHVGPEL